MLLDAVAALTNVCSSLPLPVQLVGPTCAARCPYLCSSLPLPVQLFTPPCAAVYISVQLFTPLPPCAASEVAVSLEDVCRDLDAAYRQSYSTVGGALPCPGQLMVARAALHSTARPRGQLGWRNVVVVVVVAVAV